MNRTDILHEMVAGQHAGRAPGIYSICSANRLVLEAAMMQAAADGTAVCIESTSNQVNQFGGYTGMTATIFADYIGEIAGKMGFPRERIVLGGDHLGPNAWQKEAGKPAMEKSLELVRSCVLAGYTKLHLDASMRCADDPGDKNSPLAEEIVTVRAAEMCAAAEEACRQLPAGSAKPRYIIGTEVPVPGGEQAAQSGIAVTRTADAQRTISLSKEAFEKRGLGGAWERVMAVVVQPGVEFSDNHVFEYDRGKARDLTKLIEQYDHLVFEAHSTDYQRAAKLRELVEDHFAILKVGPGLTFALREAVFALAEIETEWLANNSAVNLSRVREVMEEVMFQNPEYWKSYYRGDDASVRFARKYSYSDRCRYYWPQAKLEGALETLLANLRRSPAPLTLLSQYMPRQYEAVRNGLIANEPRALIHSKIMEVTAHYARACDAKRQDRTESSV